MSRLLCKQCGDGFLNWVEDDDEMSFKESMARHIACDICGHVYEGMDGWRNYEKHNDEIIANRTLVFRFRKLIRIVSKRCTRKFRYNLLRAKIGQRYESWMVYGRHMSEENAHKYLIIYSHASKRLRRLGDRWGYLQKWEKEMIKLDLAED